MPNHLLLVILSLLKLGNKRVQNPFLIVKSGNSALSFPQMGLIIVYNYTVLPLLNTSLGIISILL